MWACESCRASSLAANAVSQADEGSANSHHPRFRCGVNEFSSTASIMVVVSRETIPAVVRSGLEILVDYENDPRDYSLTNISVEHRQLYSGRTVGGLAFFELVRWMQSDQRGEPSYTTLWSTSGLAGSGGLGTTLTPCNQSAYVIPGCSRCTYVCDIPPLWPLKTGLVRAAVCSR